MRTYENSAIKNLIDKKRCMSVSMWPVKVKIKGAHILELQFKQHIA